MIRIHCRASLIFGGERGRQQRRAATLTPAEHEELMALTNEVVLWNARRIELVAELAQRRNVSLAAMMSELGSR